VAKAATDRPKKRAIALAGGGPAAGLHIGALAALEKHGVTFDVWSLSCIGAWVGVYYNQLTDDQLQGKGRAATTYEFFKEHAFRDTASYRGFPVNRAFAPNLQAYGSAWWKHCSDLQTYLDAFAIGNEWPAAMQGWARFLSSQDMWRRDGDLNAHVLNNILAVNPASRFLTSLLYLSEVNGLSNIYFKDSTFLDGIDIGRLDLLGDNLDQKTPDDLDKLVENYSASTMTSEQRPMPEIYHNAFRLANADPKNAVAKGELQLFNNKWVEYWRADKPRNYLPITRPSLCACSALPYVEQTVQIPNDDGHHYSEGALLDTVSFKDLVEDHPDLDEIWVCRIVDYDQVHLQKSLHDSLGNLCEQFAAEVGENDVALFKNHLRKSTGRIPRVVEIPLHAKTKVNYRWDRANLDEGFKEGKRAVEKLIRDQPDLESPDTSNPDWPGWPRRLGDRSRASSVQLGRRAKQGGGAVLASAQRKAVAPRR
jgi:predicted acylesterase/phospholipase RssA